ncbi:MAG TPA: hypothetical protein PKA43_00040 [Candidatus Competibacter phosphatis]|nr:hypothetical protein [Candidatus Competibacter phosphatis]
MYATYGTYDRFEYNTVRLPAWPVSWNSGALLRALMMVALFVAGLAVGLALFAGVYWLVMTGWPWLLGLGITAGFAWVTYPHRRG